MDLERLCSCGEEANLFCRICQIPCCWDHMCHHLSVAHSDNSYTQRLSREMELDEDKRSRIYTEDIRQREICERTPVKVSSLLPVDAWNPQSYTEDQLREALEHHRRQARRIRNELERRTLFASGIAPELWEKQQRNSLSGRYNKQQSEPRLPRSKIKPSVTKAVEVLLNQIRTGAISVEQIKAQITATRGDA